MRRLGPAPNYHFAKAYFAALRAMPHYLVTVRDADVVAAASLFLHEAGYAYRHLGSRCSTPGPLFGAPPSRSPRTPASTRPATTCAIRWAALGRCSSTSIAAPCS
jgi:hypothetical protein